MGLLKINKNWTTLMEVLVLVVALGTVGAGLYFFSPGLFVSESKNVKEIALDGVNIDNISQTEKLSLPSENVSSEIKNKPLFRIAGYAWNGNSATIVANGGPKTTEGSIMEKNGVNLEFVKQDWLSELRNMQVKFVEEMDKGLPMSDKSAQAISIMGDGAPFYISTTQKTLDEKFGKGKYHVEVVGAVGISYGEDKLIAPIEWKANPKLAVGSVISVVVGDGDWVVILNWAAAQGFKVNPDFTTYDPDAVNFYPSQDDDYMKSAEELIKSVKAGFEVELKETRDGKLTGKTVKRKIDACGTWTPGDKKVFDELTGFTDIISTREFNNQMPTTLIVVKEWAAKNPNIISNTLKSAYTAANQMKLFDEWRVRASEAVAKTFRLESPKYWYDMFRGTEGEKGGVKFRMGGTRVFNYADAMQYYGIGGDGVSRYKVVYNQVSEYLTTLNPFGFNNNVDRVTPYEEAVNLFYIKNINDVESGAVYKKDYAKTATEVVTSGDFNIAFATGSSDILPVSFKELDKIYNVLIQAEESKISIAGHTDSTGDYNLNKTLSEKRAQSVVDYFQRKGISHDRIQGITGYGSDKPVGDNATVQGRAKNRRVEVTLLK